MSIPPLATRIRTATWWPAKERRGRFADLSLMMVALTLLLSPDWGRLFSRAVALTLLASWLVLRSRALDMRKLFGPAGVLGAAGIALVLLGETAYIWAMGGCLTLGAVGLVWHRAGAPARSLSLAAASVGVFWTAWLASPWLFVPVRDAWLEWSRGIGHLFGRDWKVGPTLQGAGLALPCLALLAARCLLVEWRPRRLLAGLAAITLGAVLQLWLIDVMAARLPTQFLALLPWFGTGPVAIATASAVASVPSGDSVARGSAPAGWVLGAASCAALALAVCSHLVGPAKAPRVLFYSLNEGPILDWDRPTYGAYGAYSLGIFGLLPEHLVVDGFEVDFLRERITPAHLERVDALVTINVNTEWTEEEFFTLWTYVHEGGNLLVLGDHTGVDGSLGSQNDLLAPVGIAFQFDSAVPASPRGWGASDLYFHQLHANVDRPDDHGIAVGASLRLDDFGALPLVVGRQGLADAGVASAPERNYLGDYRYQPGEQLGDCVLAAWSRLGAGKVLVYGDTSGFQNAPIERTYDPCLRDLFGWITGETLVDLGLVWSAAASAAFLLCALGALLFLRGSGSAACWLPLLCCLTVVASRGLVGELLAREPLALPRVLIDDSHIPRTQAGSDSPRNLDGFKNTVTRSGYLPDSMQEFTEEQLARAELFVTVAPVMKYSAGELEVLQRFMQGGGFVVACASYPERAGLTGLLDSVGLEVLPRPIGSIPLDRTAGRARTQVEYIDAWQVGIEPREDGRQPWVYGAFEGLPLAVLVRHGRGGLFFVGDSLFFGSANLEALHEYSEPNILFLRSLLSDFEDLRDEAAQ